MATSAHVLKNANSKIKILEEEEEEEEIYLSQLANKRR
jgi:hypothetical protein